MLGEFSLIYITPEKLFSRNGEGLLAALAPRLKLIAIDEVSAIEAKPDPKPDPTPDPKTYTHTQAQDQS